MTNKIKGRICTAVFALSIVSLVGFGLMFARTQKAYRHSDGDLETVRAIRGEAPLVLSAEVKAQMDEASLRAAEYETALVRQESCKRLQDANPDVAAWITIEETPVDYPVMYTPDSPDYYYRRGFDGQYSAYGMIYMDAACVIQEDEAEYEMAAAEGKASPNLIIYGHHMKNGAMFASIEKYSLESYYKEHPAILFDTPDSSSLYEVVGAIRLPAEKLSNEFAAVLAARTQEEYESFVNYIKKHSSYDTGITAEWPQQLITLTTCEYTQKNGRFLLVARKKTDSR